VTRNHWSVSLLATALTCAPIAALGQQRRPELDRAFQTAVAHYNEGKLSQAARELEQLAQEVPNSFEVHELLGMVYSGESQDTLANEHLERAVQLEPASAAGHTNLATNLIRLGELEAAQEQLKKSVALDPKNFDSNHNLGELYVRMGKLPEAIPYLKRAQEVAPTYDNGYDLSMAYMLTGRTAPARQVVQTLLKQKNTAELHNLLGQIEEKDANFVVAANEFETAAHQDPSESNLFDWASELLMHRTLEPAIEVFKTSAERYPNSARMAIGLGIALYSRGKYDDAIKSLLRASDLSASDPRCYFFLSKAYDSSPSQANEVIERFRRFSEQQPDNALSYYYYAMSLWKGKRAQDPTLDRQQIESLLRRAVTLDPKLADAHLQLGNLYSDQGKYEDSIPEYERAMTGTSKPADVHYRLAQAYVHTGQKDKAQEQFQLYQQLRAQHLADLDRQVAEIRQFVYSEKGDAGAKE
jgi:tetratricopeptide (TPR) repeat protein